MFYDSSSSVANSKKPISEICFVYNRGVVLRGPEGVPTHCSLLPVCPATGSTSGPPSAMPAASAAVKGRRCCALSAKGDAASWAPKIGLPTIRLLRPQVTVIRMFRDAAARGC